MNLQTPEEPSALIPPKILLAKEIEPEKITIELINETQSNRVTNSQIESLLEDNWNKKLNEAKRKDITLYDGTSFRLEKFSIDNESLKIVVSPIKFSVRSTLKKLPDLAKLGEAYFSHGLSVGGIVQTLDDQYLFITKSNKSASDTKTDIIGGVLEKLEPLSGIGIVNMNYQELNEEANIDKSMVQNTKVIGLVRSYTTDIIIVTFTKLNVTAEQVRQLFRTNHDSEIADINFVLKNRLSSYLNGLGGYKPAIATLLELK